MKVCVLQPDYSTSIVSHGEVDPPRDLSALLPEHEVHHAFLRKATVHAQLRALRRQGFELYINLCEGYLDWDIPSVDVIHALENLGLAYTGPIPRLYDPSKVLMKRCATYAGVATPDYVLLRGLADVDAALLHLNFPVFVKPGHAGDSLGVDAGSLCADAAALRAKVAQLAPDFDDILVESYLPGREFSVLVLGEIGRPGKGRALVPNEFLISEAMPFKTYDLKARLFLPERNLPCREEPLASKLKAAAEGIFEMFSAVGYCRLDFRLDAAGEPQFIDANFACSVLYPEGYFGTADYILAHEGLGQAGFLRHIMAEGLARYHAATPPYRVADSGRGGFGLFATRAIATGEVVFRGEERAQRIATWSHVQATWPPEQQEVFRRYAYPLSDETFVLWDEDPAAWAPQNHCCDPNTAFQGLNVLAVKPIAEGEELTLDYRSFCHSTMEPFDCQCGAANCCGRVSVPGPQEKA